MMVAYSFKAQFRAPIIAGTKRQTIRADRKRHARPGEQLQLYTGMRTRQCQIIGRATCTEVQPIRIGVDEGWIMIGATMWSHPHLVSGFAQLDGFPDWPAMQAFWRATHPGIPVFSGVLIRWGDLQAGAPDA